MLYILLYYFFVDRLCPQIFVKIYSSLYTQKSMVSSCLFKKEKTFVIHHNDRHYCTFCTNHGQLSIYLEKKLQSLCNCSYIRVFTCKQWSELPKIKVVLLKKKKPDSYYHYCNLNVTCIHCAYKGCAYFL